LRHFNIPIFIPELACPFRCVYCNQFNITGSCKAPDADVVRQIIDKHLTTLPVERGRVEVAFFGGSFTGLGIAEQNKYLDLMKPYIDKGRVQGIRISTRPDYISEEVLQNLKGRSVVAIELGAQSMDDEVLILSGRGHTVSDVVEASRWIKSMGLELGLQMMTGLPGDTFQKSMETAMQIVACQAQTTRIYPTLVIKDTPLAELYASGQYRPQSLSEAIDLCARLYDLFADANVKILRMGLHPSEGFISQSTLIAGPYHSAFGELVLSKVWQNRFELNPGFSNGKEVNISVHPSDLNAAIGHKGQNKLLLYNYYSKVRFIADVHLPKNEFYVDIYR
jgi:histone acetyltransferase (RNA polymerase elongator complex component)